MKEQKKKKGTILIAESTYNAQNAQFGLVMYQLKKIIKIKELNRPDLSNFLEQLIKMIFF